MALVGSALLAQPTVAVLGSPDQSIWFTSVITIITLATIFPCSQAADYWGRKVIILSTALGGVVGSIVVSRARSTPTAIAGFCLIAIAFGCQSLCYAIPSEVLHRKHRAYGQAATNVAAGMGAVVGILVGGALTRNGNPDGFRIFWYINCGVWVLGFAGVLAGYNPPPRELQMSLTTTQKLQFMDWIGNALVAIGLVLLCVGLQWSNNPYPWTDGHVVGPLSSGLFLLVAFCIYEWRCTEEGILHHGLFGDRNFPLAMVMIITEGSAFITTTSFFVFELVVVGHFDSFSAGLRFAVLFLISTAFSFIVGAYTSWTRQIREPLVVGFLLLLIFNILMAYYKTTLSSAASYGYACIGGAGIGCILINAMVAAQMSTPRHMISVTSGLITALRSLGAAIGLAIVNAIFHNSISSELPKRIAAAVLPLGLPPAELGHFIRAFTSRNETALMEIPGFNPIMLGASGIALTEAYRVSFRNTWFAAAGFCAVGIVGRSSVNPTYIYCR